MKSIMRLPVFLLLGLSANVFVQGARRVIKVRKTGEFGRKLNIAPPLSQLYEPPKRFMELDPFYQTSETRNNYIGLGGIPKPSQKLELPSYSHPGDDIQIDSIAAETGDSPQGYAATAYPDPDSESIDGGGGSGYQFDPVKIKHPESDPATERVDDLHKNAVPQVAEFPFPEANPFRSETQEQIDADEQRPNVSPRNPPSAELNTHRQNQQQSQSDGQQQQCSDNDPDCWPHGYEGVIPGQAGTDYPTLREIVDTPFSCDNVQYSGYYADADAASRCQIFHVCLKGNAYRQTQKWSFLCPNGTVFSQGDFVCVWWHSAPECNSGVVDELSLRNAELGWDNLTETEAAGGGNFASSRNRENNNNENNNLQTSGSSNLRVNNYALPAPTTTKRTPSRSTIPYRVPVKVNDPAGRTRTQLKEVAGNTLQGDSSTGNNNEAEYTGEETEAYETSLSQQSESRHRSKTASALAKSESEGYEQKSVPDSLKPGGSGVRVKDTTSYPDGQNLQAIQQGEFSEEQEQPQVEMMASLRKNPDGSNTYAEVPVMGYRYPVPTVIPDLGQNTYLPPRNEFLPRSTTTTELPNTTTFLPVTEDSVESVQGGYQEQYTNTEGPSAPLMVTTTEQGYNYRVPTTTQQSGYNYASPTTTENSSYQEIEEQVLVNSSVGPDEEGLSAYEASTTYSPSETTTNSPSFSTTTSTRATTTTTRKVEPVGTYLPPPRTQQPQQNSGGYLRSSPPAVAAIQSNNADVLRLPTSTSTSTEDLFRNKLTGTTTSNAPETGDYINSNSGVSESSTGGYSSSSSADKSTPTYTIPTPVSGVASGGGPTTGDNLDTTTDDRVNKILQEIQNGGAEVRDENGKTLNFEELRKLILSTPDGLLSLQKADDSLVTPNADSSTSSQSTEPPISSSLGQNNVSETELQDDDEGGGEDEGRLLQQVKIDQTPKRPTLEQVQTIEENPPPPPSPTSYYLPSPPSAPVSVPFQPLPQQSYFSNDRLVSIKRPGFDISTPSKEYETHAVQQNTLEQPSPFSGFTNFQTQTRESPIRNQFNQNDNNINFASHQKNTPQPPQGYYQSEQPQRQLQHFRQPSQPAPALEVNFRPSVPQPDQYYRTQQPSQTLNTQQQQQQQFNTNSGNSYFQPQNQQRSNQPTQSSNNFRFPSVDKPIQPPQNQQQKYFEIQPPTQEYLPPPRSPPQYSTLPSTPTRDLTTDIQLQQSFSYPLPQGSASTNSRNLANPHDIKVVPALLVNAHTRVELPNGQVSNNANLNQQHRHQYSSQSVTHPVKVRAPRLNPFTLADALPKREKFTPQESRSRTAEQIHSASSAVLSGERGYLSLPFSSEHNSLTNNFYPGRDNSLGVKLTYNNN